MRNASYFEEETSCPSAQPEWKGSVAIGVVQGTADEPRMTHLSRPLAVDDQLLSLSGPVTPTEIFRFAAPCLRGECLHFKNDSCGLAAQIVQLLPTVAETLPRCTLRPHCRWWLQEGKAACLRCPQVVTDNYNPSRAMIVAATPGRKSLLRPG